MLFPVHRLVLIYNVYLVYINIKCTARCTTHTHPILVEDVYLDDKTKIKLKRLHAHFLTVLDDIQYILFCVHLCK